jgi:hypothetical protein
MQGIQKLAADAVRFANELRAWVEVEDGRVTGHGHLGGGRIGGTTLRAGSKRPSPGRRRRRPL